MVNLWLMYGGFPMVTQWLLCGYYMVPMVPHFMVIIWFLHKSCMVSLWFLWFPMVTLIPAWFTHSTVLWFLTLWYSLYLYGPFIAHSIVILWFL